MEVPPAKQSNFETFRDCLSVQLVSKLAPRNDDKKKRARNRKKSLHVNDMVSVGTNVEGQDANSEETDAEELAEFVDVCSPSFQGLGSCTIFIVLTSNCSIWPLRYSLRSQKSYEL